MRRLVITGLAALVGFAGPAVPSTASTSGTPGGVAAVTYSVPNGPSAGATSVSFPLLVLRNASPSASWYWADEVEFAGDSSIAYMGLQPNGQYGRTALFSVFGDGTHGSGAHCFTGADGGSGTSCHIPYAWHPDRTYLFTMKRMATKAASETWRGTVTDTTTRRTTTIGQWSVGIARGLISPLLGFSEYFSTVSDCAAMPHMVTRYGAPSESFGGHRYAGTVSSAYTYGSTSGSYIDCSTSAYPSHTKAGAVVQAPTRGYDAPQVATALRIHAVPPTSRNALRRVRLTWHAARAPLGIASYLVYRNGHRVGTTAQSSWTGRRASRSALWTVQAVDRHHQHGPVTSAVSLPRTG